MSSRRLISEWFDSSSVHKMLDRFICEGDLLEFEDKEKNMHWGVYVGHKLYSGKKMPSVIHFSTTKCCNGSLPGDSVKEAIFGGDDAYDGWCILEDKLEDLLKQYSSVRISNGLDMDFEPYCSSDIVQKATEKKDEGIGDDDEWVLPTTFRSCKHFALFCRYDENLLNSVTEETQKKVENIKLAAATAAGASVLGLAGYLLYKSCSTPEKKNDSKK